MVSGPPSTNATASSNGCVAWIFTVFHCMRRLCKAKFLTESMSCASTTATMMWSGPKTRRHDLDAELLGERRQLAGARLEYLPRLRVGSRAEMGRMFSDDSELRHGTPLVVVPSSPDATCRGRWPAPTQGAHEKTLRLRLAAQGGDRAMFLGPWNPSAPPRTARRSPIRRADASLRARP